MSATSFEGTQAAAGPSLLAPARGTVARVQPSTARNAAVAGSLGSALLTATVATTPGSPFQPILPTDARPAGPFRWLAHLVRLDQVHGSALAIVGVVAVALAVAGFLAILREARRGTVSARAVTALAVAYQLAVMLLPLLFSRDVYSYSAYGRIAAIHHANPYVATPADFPHDAVTGFVGPKWIDTPAVYGPLFTFLSSLVVRMTSSVGGAIVAFRAIAVAASLGTIAILARITRRVRPSREAFAIAAFGLNPAVVFQSVASGHNDLLVALAIVGALALLLRGRELLATAVLAMGALVKAPAAVPLLLLVVVAVARREPGRRARAALAHVGVAGAITVLAAAPFLQTSDPSLGMLELARHEGWLAPSRLVRRALDAVSGDALGVVARIAFALALLASIALVAAWLVRRARSVSALTQGAVWGWGLILLMLLGPVLLPWYVTWSLPLVWLLPRAPRFALIGTGVALTLSQWTTEPGRFRVAYDANVLFGHYVLTPVVIVLLGWVGLDLLRRLRAGASLEEPPDEVAARPGGDEHDQGAGATFEPESGALERDPQEDHGAGAGGRSQGDRGRALAGDEAGPAGPDR